MQYYILSGEGTAGTWTGPHNGDADQAMAHRRREACGARWASAWELVPESRSVRAHVRCLVTGEMRDVPGDVRAAAATLGAIGGAAGTGDAKRRPQAQYLAIAAKSAAVRRRPHDA